MAILKGFKKTGNRNPLFQFAVLALLVGLGPGTAVSRAESRVSAEVDRNVITAEESVSLKISVQAEGNTPISGVRLNAPDFDIINEYESSHFQSYYENGHFGTRTTQSVTKVLRPTKTGQLRISGISVEAGGQRKTAPDIVIQVTPAGSATSPTRNYGGAGVGLRGSAKNGIVKPVFIRAELDKSHAYKGEQLIVSFYLYSRVRMFDISATKFPETKGFLREELEMPLSGARLDSERVIHDGVPYERSLLVRYALYPLQEGKLTIDPIHLLYTYTPTRGLPGFDSNDDPFMQFFSSMTPRQGRDKSDAVTIESLPLPEDGRPASFSGGVGDFNVGSAVDKYSVRANEAVTLTVKIEGKGNVAAIGEPKAKWPDQIELYDTKGRAKSSKGGVGEKIFEFLLIPRTPGQLQLPPLDFSYFDPGKKQYVTKTTEPFSIQVLDPAPGSALVPVGKPATAQATPMPGAADPLKQDLRYLMPPSEGQIGLLGYPLWRWLYWAAAGALLLFAALVLWDFTQLQRARVQQQVAEKNRIESKSWDKLRHRAASAKSWQEVVDCYEKIGELLLDHLETKFPIGVRSFSRKDLEQMLVTDRGLDANLWERISRILEHVEVVQFASSAGAISEATARSELAKWVDDARALARTLEKEYKSS